MQHFCCVYAIMSETSSESNTAKVLCQKTRPPVFSQPFFLKSSQKFQLPHCTAALKMFIFNFNFNFDCLQIISNICESWQTSPAGFKFTTSRYTVTSAFHQHQSAQCLKNVKLFRKLFK